MKRLAPGTFRRYLGEGLRLAELLIFPSRCRICRALLEGRGERVVCRSCLDQLVPCRFSFCTCCGKFFDGAAAPHLCLDCLKARPPYGLHRSCAAYEGTLREVIILMKYRGFSVLARDLAAFALAAVGRDETLWAGVEAIIPVPLHRRKKKTRGFNQAELIARDLGRAKNLRVERRILFRSKNIPAQSGLDAEDRRHNVAGAFCVRHPEKVKGRTVLLVDDVYTTGSTVKECCRTLRRAGTKEVRVLTMART